MLLFSCAKGYGNKLTAKNLNVYFEQKKDEKAANALGKFWQDKGLVGEREQNIMLRSDKDFYYIYLIQTKDYREIPMNFQEHKLLLELQEELDSVVFKATKPCKIVISNERFQELQLDND